MILPKFSYPGGLGGATVNFTPTWPCVKKTPFALPVAVRHDSITISGLKQSILERLDYFQDLYFDDVPVADAVSWNSFLNYALTGGQFNYYADSTSTLYEIYTLEDYAWGFKFRSWNNFTFSIKIRRAPGTVLGPIPTADLTGDYSGSDLVTTSGSVLSVTNNIVYVQYSAGNFAGSFGPLTISGLTLASGDFPNGGTLTGGTLTITISGHPLSFSGVPGTLTWTKATLAAGHHRYQLTGTFSSSQGTGAITLQTIDIGTGLWTGSAGVYTDNIHYN